MSQILQSHPSLKSSSAVDLLDLYLCLWECYTIKSAGKIRLEEERRFLQDSNKWLVRENKKLQQYCNHQELLLWDHRQAFVSVHQGVLGTLQSSDRPSCQINYDSDLDLESIWREFPNIPTPPPCLAESHSTLCSNQSLKGWLEYTQHGHKGTPAIECVFYPSYENVRSFSWTGPDPLSQDTCADDIFLYVSAFFLFERVDWIELRLSKLSTETGEAVEEYPFFLPRVESMLGNLRRIRCQISDILSQNSTVGNITSAGQSRFQLAIRPRVDITDNSTPWSSVPLSRIHPSIPMPFLDPQIFVQNIVGNWEL
ncbi:uncharacterized protein N7525_007331 [Penicillium rubens]|uniref:uncharacterized protein n=1 Tax=Penicillium rubens TaxID=1108849 RepID=UPI002A5A64CC|nr:uncharacterized protein N7525_007331 [Penicillium rubens]KAJ5829078.1 hypothetical protein N7525_007331 [Penicillium rubens]